MWRGKHEKTKTWKNRFPASKKCCTSKSWMVTTTSKRMVTPKLNSVYVHLEYRVFNTCMGYFKSWVLFIFERQKPVSSMQDLRGETHVEQLFIIYK